jgi:hypothetical protein
MHGQVRNVPLFVDAEVITSRPERSAPGFQMVRTLPHRPQLA